jgi:hypothetical protein
MDWIGMDNQDNMEEKWYKLRSNFGHIPEQRRELITRHEEPTYYRRFVDSLNQSTLNQAVKAHNKWADLNKQMQLSKTDLKHRDLCVAAAEESRKREETLLLSMKRDLVGSSDSLKKNIKREAERYHNELRIKTEDPISEVLFWSQATYNGRDPRLDSEYSKVQMIVNLLKHIDSEI